VPLAAARREPSPLRGAGRPTRAASASPARARIGGRFACRPRCFIGPDSSGSIRASRASVCAQRIPSRPDFSSI